MQKAVVSLNVRGKTVQIWFQLNIWQMALKCDLA